MIRPLLLALAWLLLADVAAAQTCVVQTNGDCMLEPTAAEGQDVSPYCFLPALARGQYETNYAFTAFDTGGVCHHFQTYLRFELPPDLLDPGETVTTARLLLYYAFTFAFEGPAPTVPHAPITVNIHQVLAPWTGGPSPYNEDAVTWSNRPPHAAAVAGTRNDITNFGVQQFFVTDLVRSWAHGTKPNHGFVVVSPNDIPFGMHSWEAEPPVTTGQKARLRITVGPGSPPQQVPFMPAWITALLVIAVATLLALYMPRASGRL